MRGVFQNAPHGLGFGGDARVTHENVVQNLGYVFDMNDRPESFSGHRFCLLFLQNFDKMKQRNKTLEYI